MRYSLYNAGALNLTNFILFLSLAGGLIHPVEASTLPKTCEEVSRAESAGLPAHSSAERDFVIVVDPFGYQAGELLADFAEGRGLEPIFVFSRPDLPAYLTANFPREKSKVIQHVYNPTTLAEIQRRVGKRKVRAVLPGTESGVRLANGIAHNLGLLSNRHAYSAAWREKATMHKFLEREGIAFAPSERVENLQQAMAFIEARIKDFPKTEVVLKPPSSAGTDRVFFCKTEKEIEEALRQIFAKPDAFGAPNYYAIIQERLLGDEYIVDTVSTEVRTPDGEARVYHRLVGAWRYHRRPSAIPGMADVIDHVSWVPVNQLPDQMVSYSRSVLDKLHVTFGPAHLEIMQTARGPVLIELGARLPGGLPLLAARATGDTTHQIQLSWEAVLDPAQFVRDYEANGGTYATQRDADIVFLSVENSGQYLNEASLAQINRENFPTLDSFRILGKTDGELELTTNVTNALLRAHFVGDPEAVAKDRKKLQEIHGRKEFFR